MAEERGLILKQHFADRISYLQTNKCFRSITDRKEKDSSLIEVKRPDRR